jgi:hypothetical protein
MLADRGFGFGTSGLKMRGAMRQPGCGLRHESGKEHRK